MTRRDLSAAGAVTPLVAAVVALAGVATLAVGRLGAGTVTRARAETAADASALAGAGRVVLADGDPCAAAAETAGRNDARLLACDLEADGVEVTVSVAGPLGLVARARARAEVGFRPLPDDDLELGGVLGLDVGLPGAGVRE